MVVGYLHSTLQAAHCCELACNFQRTHHLLSLDSTLEHSKELFVNVIYSILDLAV